MRLLRDNGIQGLILVFLLLTLFLEVRLAFWVAMGIPISVLGAGIVLLMTGQTLNMLSMFAFLWHWELSSTMRSLLAKTFLASQYGQVAHPSSDRWNSRSFTVVFSSVATTVIAFLPMLFVSGVMGKFIAVMPAAIIAMLIISLIEASFSLPCHLAHLKPTRDTSQLSPLRLAARKFSQLPGRGLDWVGDRLYQPVFSFLMRYPLIAVCGALTVLIVTAGAVRERHCALRPLSEK